MLWKKEKLLKMTYIYVMPPSDEYDVYRSFENGGIPPQQVSNDSQQTIQKTNKKHLCSKFFMVCKRNKNSDKEQKEEKEEKIENKILEEDMNNSTCFKCLKKTNKSTVSTDVKEDITTTKTIWGKLKCCNKNKVIDNNDSVLIINKKNSFDANKKNSFRSLCSKFCRTLLCTDKCKRKPKIKEVEDSRRPSMMSKKKSLTSSIPVEEVKRKLDVSLVEHTSPMKAAIPVLPISLSWFCLIMNCIAPGTGTVFSGMFCLCFGIPRFSQKDGFRQRIWAFIINTIIGFSQFFTVLFCLVGWGWSIWWGIIMIKLARKNAKIAILQAHAADEGVKQVRSSGQNNVFKDAEKGI